MIHGLKTPILKQWIKDGKWHETHFPVLRIADIPVRKRYRIPEYSYLGPEVFVWATNKRHCAMKTVYWWYWGKKPVWGRN